VRLTDENILEHLSKRHNLHWEHILTVITRQSVTCLKLTIIAQ